MVNSENNRQCEEDDDRGDQNFNGDDSITDSSCGAETSADANPSIVRRLTEIFMDDGDGDLLLQTSDREDGFLQWFRALDFQVMGACRADERLKPLLKLNFSTGAAEDRLLAHLCQHFEPSEIAILARCLCVPLVSIRVGKIDKRGTLFSPTSIRGNLCLTLLPTSDLRISFNGDGGSMERLATFSTKDQCTAIDIEEISTDKSGRSFLIKISDAVVCYFWCSEKSKLLGNELLKNMKDLLMRKHTLAELSGISESRLNFFATHVHAYLAGSVVTKAQVSGVLSASPSSDNTIDPCEQQFPQSSTCQKFSYIRHCGGQGSKTNSNYQGNLSPKSSPFKEGMSKSLSSMKSAAREKLKWCVENYVSSIENFAFASSSNFDRSSTNCVEQDKLSEPDASQSSSAFSLLDILGKSQDLPFSGSEVQIPSSGSSHFSPQYCWCPPVVSALQYTKGNLHLPISSSESLSLPPLSSLLSATRQSRLLTSKPSLNMAEVPPLEFPTFIAEPLVRLPTSQQIPTFIPLICDPIIHVPVIDVFSSGQGYLVSTGPAIPTTISPLNPSIVDPLPDAESVLEKGARETLRMLISNSSQPQLLDVLPSMLSSSDDNQNVIAAGSRGLYSGTIDVDVLAHSLTTMGLVLLSEKPIRSGIGKRCGSREDLIDPKENPSSSGTSSFDEGID